MRRQLPAGQPDPARNRRGPLEHSLGERSRPWSQVIGIAGRTRGRYHDRPSTDDRGRRVRAAADLGAHLERKTLRSLNLLRNNKPRNTGSGL